MKIIKTGNRIEPANTYELECKRCGCIFTFEADEVIIPEKRLMGGPHIKCPCCGIILELEPWIVL